MTFADPAGGLRQTTLGGAISCRGIGLHSGRRANLTLRPAAPDTGVRFRRTDAAADGFEVRATVDAVVDSRLCTSVGTAGGPRIGTVEHLLAALRGCGVDNVLIDIDGPEVPIMDGSSAPFVFLVESVGLAEQDAPRRAIEILRPLAVTDGDRQAELRPGEGFSMSFRIEYANAAIGCQELSVGLGHGVFKSEIARARTYGFEHEVAAMRAAGLAAGGDLSNAVVIRGDRVLNDEGLRYADEFVRHKLLDSVGDLYLVGAPIVGHFRGVKSGHALNHALLRRLFAEPQAWRWVAAEPEIAAAPRARARA